CAYAFTYILIKSRIEYPSVQGSDTTMFKKDIQFVQKYYSGSFEFELDMSRSKFLKLPVVCCLFWYRALNNN
ncbi:MAG TPA: hypothetical protein VF540_02170, partial [Segetibacter sp.]